MSRLPWLLLVAVLAVWGPLVARAEAPAIAVLDLSNDTGDKGLDGAGAGVAGLLVAKLARTDSLRVVERQQLAALLSEIELGRSGAVDPETAARAGKLVGADYVVLGSLFSVKLPTVAVSVRVVDASDGTVVVAEEVRGEVGERGESFFVLVDDLAWRVLDGLEVRLSGAERIEFSQVDARRLETVSVYGEALRAIDAAQPDVAERLLGRAMSLEPEFTLAEEALASLAVEVGERRATYAHAAVAAYRTWLDHLDAATRVEAPVADKTSLCQLAIQARLHLVRGDFDDFLAVETQRLVLWEDYAAKVAPQPGVMKLHTEYEVFQRLAERWVHAEGSEAPGVAALVDLAFWPWEIRLGMAEVRLLVGQREAALEGVVDLYRHPGPNQRPRARWTPPAPPHPRDWARERGLLEDAVPLFEQALRQAEIAGDEQAAEALVRELDDLLAKVAERRRAATRHRDPLAYRVSKKRDRATLDAVVDEAAALVVPLEQPALAHAQYRAFQARREAGYYDDVRGDPAFGRLAAGWRDIADGLWSQPWYLERRLGHLLAYQDALRTGEPAADRALDQALETFVEEHYQ